MHIIKYILKNKRVLVLAMADLGCHLDAPGKRDPKCGVAFIRLADEHFCEVFS